MAVALRSPNGTNSGDNANLGNITVALPTGAQATDVVVAVLAADGGSNPTVTFSTPSGWTQVGATIGVRNGVTSVVTLAAYWALGTVASLTFTVTGVHSDTGWVTLAFTGVDNVTPIDATGTGNTASSAASVSVATFSTATDGALEVIGYADWNSGTLTQASFNIFANAGANAGCQCLYGKSAVSPAGGTGAFTINDSGSTTGQILAYQQFALRPAAAGGGAPAGRALAALQSVTGSVYF